MNKLVFYTSIAFLTLFAQSASAWSIEEAFYDVVNKEAAGNRRSAQECDARECRRWWWRDEGRFSLLAVEHVKAGRSERVLAVCIRDVASTEDMQCVATSGRKFAVSSNDAERWRGSYLSANASPPRPRFSPTPVSLELDCSAPVVTKGNADPGRNPVVSARVRIERGDWSVTFKFADGSFVARADQYDGGGLSAAQVAQNNVGAKQPAIAQWAGGHKRRTDVLMIGSLYQDAPASYRYVEIVASARHPEDAKVMVARCEPFQATAPRPASPAPSTNPAEPGEAGMTFNAMKNDDCSNCVTLSAVGNFVPGTDTAFVAAVQAQEAKGQRVSSVRLASPGGAVLPALSMGRAIRQAGIKTIVDRICVSACALAFMGGATRQAAPMTLGVHQISFAEGTQLSGAATAVASQASISELLIYAKEMGVDSEVISIAAATLPNAMHYFGATELSALNLITK